jgi:hypothetical protein
MEFIKMLQNLRIRRLQAIGNEPGTLNTGT